MYKTILIEFLTPPLQLFTTGMLALYDSGFAVIFNSLNMANLQNSRFSATFTQKETDELATGRKAYFNVLQAKTVALTPEERDGFNGIEVDNYVFVKDTLSCNDAEGVAMMPPAYAAMAPELVLDNTAFDQFDAEKLLLKDLLQRVQDTKRLVAQEAYSVATKYYKLYKQMAEDGVPGAAARYELLKKRFKDNGAGRPKDEPTVE